MNETRPAKQEPNRPYRQWHRLFGLLLSDYLTGTPFTVELEKDLSHKRQMLDVLVVRRGPGPMTRPLPDGLNDLTDHNLITFKSFRESLDDWALKELTGHYVNYRKSTMEETRLLPENRFQLYAICARHPEGLFRHARYERIEDGVYLVERGTDRIRIIVMKELPEEEQNALLHLFSAVTDKVKYGADHYELQSDATSTIVGQLFGTYRGEGLNVPYTIEDFKRDLLRDHMAEFPPGERLVGLSAEDRLAGMAPEQRLAGLAPEQRLAGLAPEQRLAGLAPEQRLAGLSIEQIESFLNREKKRISASHTKKDKTSSKRSATAGRKKK